MTTIASQGRVMALPQRPTAGEPVGRGVTGPAGPTGADEAEPGGRAEPGGPGGPVVPAGRFDLRLAWQEHGRALLGTATAILGDRHAAEDCVQETFVRAWRARDRFDAARGSERTWLFGIARNVAVDHLRARARRAVPVADEHVARRMPPTASPQASVEARVVLLEALTVLSEEHREVLVATRLEGLSYADLSERVGVPVPTLRTRAFHALRALRAHLGPHPEEGELP